MATPLVQSLGAELDSIAANYEAQFAGQSRATRNLDELDSIVARTKEVLQRLEAIPSAARSKDLQELVEIAQKNLAMYAQERELIVRAKQSGPELEEFAPLATSANLIFARYARHYAGQSRSTRDLAQLEEMHAELAKIHTGMKAVLLKARAKGPLEGDVKLVGETLEMYKGEIKEIAAAQQRGTPEEQASLLATLANAQFRLYQVHFAGRGRATRRPALLVRMIESLEGIQKRMKKLASTGLKSESNDKNVEIVQSQLDMFRQELGAIRAAKKEASITDLMGMLGGAANEVFGEYEKDFAGKDRRTRDLQLLSDICDRLGEIRRQMIDLERAEANEMNERNLEIVTQQLQSFEAEWERVKEAQESR
jgi:hypothetical protein